MCLFFKCPPGPSSNDEAVAIFSSSSHSGAGFPSWRPPASFTVFYIDSALFSVFSFNPNLLPPLWTCQVPYSSPSPPHHASPHVVDYLQVSQRLLRLSIVSVSSEFHRVCNLNLFVIMLKPVSKAGSPSKDMAMARLSISSSVSSVSSSEKYKSDHLRQSYS